MKFEIGERILIFDSDDENLDDKKVKIIQLPDHPEIA
jgi:hypothetical protein